MPPRRAPRPSPRRDARTARERDDRRQSADPLAAGPWRSRAWRSGWSRRSRPAWPGIATGPGGSSERAEAADSAPATPADGRWRPGRRVQQDRRLDRADPPGRGPGRPRARPARSRSSPNRGASSGYLGIDPSHAPRSLGGPDSDLLRLLDRSARGLPLWAKPCRVGRRSLEVAPGDPRRWIKPSPLRFRRVIAPTTRPETASIAGSLADPSMTSTPGSPALGPGSPPPSYPGDPDRAARIAEAGRRSSREIRPTSTPKRRRWWSPWATLASPTGAGRSSKPGRKPPETPGSTGFRGRRRGTSTTTDNPARSRRQF